MNLINKRLIIIIIIGLIASFITNVLLLFSQITHSSQEKKFPLLSQQIKNDVPSRNLIINMTDLRQSLFEKTATLSGSIGLYFEYLPTGTTIGINQRENFTIASLLKIPIAMAALEKTHENKLKLSDTIILTKDMMKDTFGDLWKKGVGTNITVKEALELLLINSDNTAAEALMSRITPEELGRVFTAFDMSTTIEGNTLVITPKGYTSILRSLYYSTHLPPSDSQYILELLSKSMYLDGKKQSTIPVIYAHKIGVHDLTSTYSDCGITYIPNHPYIICIMIKDKSIEEARTIITEILDTIYIFINQKAQSLE